MGKESKCIADTTFLDRQGEASFSSRTKRTLNPGHRRLGSSVLLLLPLFSFTNRASSSELASRVMASRLDTRTFKDEVTSMDKRCLLDLGHPLLNRVADSFIRAAGVGAVRAVTREAYFVTVDGLSGDSSTGLDPNVPKRSHFSSIRGDDGQNSLEAVVKSAGKEAFQWGLAAGVHSGITYGLREARGCHDWKNSAIAGAIAGVAVALTGDAGGHSDKIVHFAITGAALSSAANLLSGVF